MIQGLGVQVTIIPRILHHSDPEVRAVFGCSGIILFCLFQDGLMKRDRAFEVLSRLKPRLQSEFGVTRLAFFGSTARDTAQDDSDIDALVDFDGPATSKRFFGVQFLIEDELGCQVDLVTEKALRKELRPYIEKEQVVV